MLLPSLVVSRRAHEKSDDRSRAHKVVEMPFAAQDRKAPPLNGDASVPQHLENDCNNAGICVPRGSKNASLRAPQRLLGAGVLVILRLSHASFCLFLLPVLEYSQRPRWYFWQQGHPSQCYGWPCSLVGLVRSRG